MSGLVVLYAVVSFATAVAVVLICLRWHHLSRTAGYKRLSPRTYSWALSYAILPAALGCLSLMGYYKGSPLGPFLLSAGVFICVMGTLHRENGKTFLRTVLDFVSAYTPWNVRPRRPKFVVRLSEKRRERQERREEEETGSEPSRLRTWRRNVLTPWLKGDFSRLAVAALLSFISLEICWHLDILGMNPVSFLIDWGMVLFAMLAMYFLFQQLNWGAIVISVAVYVIGIIEYFVVVLKGSVIQAGDVFALGTAAAVSDGLNFDFGGTVLLGAIAFDLSLLALSRVSPIVRRATIGLNTPTGDDGLPLDMAPEAEAAAEKDEDDGADAASDTEAEAASDAGAAAEKDIDADTGTEAEKDADAEAGTEKPASPEANGRGDEKPPLRRVVVGVVSNLVLSAVCVGGAWAMTHAAYAWTQLLGTKFWQPIVAYADHGFLTSFFSMWYGMPIEVPEGYDANTAARIESDLARAWEQASAEDGTYEDAKNQFDQAMPNIIVVQNETFADLSKFYDIGYTGYTGPEYFNSISDALVRGTLDVSVVGGGTCNSEFEFLTGNSMAYVGTGKYPYNLYNFTDVESLPKQLSELGYATAAIHPNLASNWNRDKVYPQLGFDAFYDIDDFEGAPVFHNGVTDLATYDKIIELIEETDEPMFVLDVTMQNHTGYDVKNIPLWRLTDYQLQNVSQYENDEFNEYVSCIEASDEDLATFMDELRKLNEPVILVFYGDHQPNISSNFLNDSVYPNEDPNSLDHQLRAFKTQYFIWANYNVAGTPGTSQEMETSISYLGSYLMEIVGGPLSNHEKANLQTALNMPLLTLMGYADTQGNWYESSTDLTQPSVSGDSAAAEAYRNLDMVQYLEFGSRVKR